MASVGEKFDAAVSVIKKLPKNGPFQPSYELMKRFYGLYKQATEGPCRDAKPAFWNVVQTQKWQAWSALGNMKSEEAKTLYVDELLKTILDNSKARDIPHLYKIIETMPQTEDVVSFLKVMGPFFELVSDEQEAEQKEEEPSPSPQVTKVKGHMNGDVKMKEPGVDERGDQAQTLQNGDLSDASDYTTGHLEGDPVMRSGHDHPQSERFEVMINGHMERGEEGNEEAIDNNFVRVETVHRGENSAELSHPILVAKSQLEAAELHQPVESESESDADDEFCDSVDEPLISRISLAHISKTDSLPAVVEEEDDSGRKQLTSTPFSGDHAVVTTAQIHNNIDAVIEPRYTTSTSATSTTATHSVRGGGEVTQGSKESSSAQSNQGHSRGYRPSESFQAPQTPGSHDSPDSGRSSGGRGGAGGGRTPGGEGSPLRSPLPDGVVEQITISLERLQRDMNSVLVRLNTLETIAISRHQLETQQAYMREGIPHHPDGAVPFPPRPASSPSWWPFPTLPMRTVFILLVWPFIVQWIFRFLARRKRARPPPR